MGIIPCSKRKHENSAPRISCSLKMTMHPPTIHHLLLQHDQIPQILCRKSKQVYTEKFAVLGTLRIDFHQEITRRSGEICARSRTRPSRCHSVELDVFASLGRRRRRGLRPWNTTNLIRRICSREVSRVVMSGKPANRCQWEVCLRCSMGQ